MTTISIRYLIDGAQRRSTYRETEDYRVSVYRKNERVQVEICAKKPIELISCSFKKPFHYHRKDQIYLNGYQSWTDTREYDLSEEIHNLNRLPQGIKHRYHFEMYGDSWFWKYHDESCHSFTYSYIRRGERSAFIGSLGDENAYLIIHHKKKENEMSIRSDCEHKKLKAGEKFKLYDFVYYVGDVQENLKRYFAHFGICKSEKISGYTSWYLDYQDINDEKIHTALAQTDPDNFDLFQIDDGYETFVGDWMDIDPVKFPHGLQDIVTEIHQKGLKAGIWLAPFVCEVDSRLYREHPDWIFREDNQDVYAGSNWSGDVVLDLRKQEVMDYIRECLQYYIDTGFDFFKLDFLYAAALVHGNGKTRAEMMRLGMKFLREVLKNKLILGCGVPLSSAFNLVDYCRIGPDVSLEFDDVFYMRRMHRERISTKTTLQNTIYRSCMDGYVFGCDPDVFLLRDDQIKLSGKQRRALVTLNHLCGSVYLTSDRVGEYDDEKKTWLNEARKLTDASVTSVKRTKDLITITYELHGQESRLVYDREKGVLL